MYTVFLWRALQMPPTKNPLFKQMQTTGRFSWLDRFWNGLMALLLVLLFVKPPLFVIIILSIPIAYPMVSSTCYGVLFSLRTSHMIFIRRQQGSYDLIRIAPGGAWQSFWAVCAGSVHRNDDLDRLNRYLIRIMTMLITLGVFIFFASFVVPTDRLKIEFLTMAIVLATIISLMYLEFSQSSILSILIGMTFAIYGRTTIDSRIGALVGFLTLQLTTYLTSAVLAVSFLYPMIERLDMSSVLAMFLGCSVLVCYIALSRELFMFLLWRLISRRLNTAHDEMRHIAIHHRWLWQ